MMMMKQNKNKIAALPLRRFVETVVALGLSFYTLACFPFLVSVFGEYFSRVSATISSPIFVFTILNASILLLSVAHSGQSEPQKLVAESESVPVTDERKIDDESADKFEIAASGDVDFKSSHVATPALVETEQLIVNFDEEEVNETYSRNKMMNVAAVDQKLEFESRVVEAKYYRRTRSESLRSKEDYGCKMRYRRSETERCLEMVKAAEDVAAAAASKEDDDDVVDELSNVEFNRIIEAFLEKQKRFHYQENKQSSILV